MKKILVALTLFAICLTTASAQSVIEIEPNQSMHLIGKGPGQESVINPYAGFKSAAIVENMGKDKFDIRIQVKGKIIRTLVIDPGKTKEIVLEQGYELYIDGYAEARSKARIDFRKL